ncbi:uncharacterized protein LOC116288302 [Actinia tenebrosa]|uniref:Uncharacterized protein LOC116288302 n=1 Tax=Actinia tenebrosa TaxID=6105 RepID=A0A6P8HED8_ACTTE|nr:uncharacterized protein LOC116288302 [Actinia tenebrosa]
MPTKVPNRKKKPGLLGTTTNGGAGSFNDSAMDEFLAKRGLYRKPIAKDGSCLFRAVSEQVHNCQARHLDVRNQCIAFMRQNRGLFEEFVEGPFDHHLFKLQNPKEWAGQVEITALSQMYRKDFVVYQDINSLPTKVTDHGYKDKILLCYSNGNHYDIIYPNKFQEHAAMCQSLLYEMVYNKVFIELDKKEKKGKQKGTSTVTENSRNDQKSIMELVNGCMTDGTDAVENSGDDDGWTEVKSKARAKHERLSKPVEVEETKEAEETKSKPSDDQKNLWELRRSVDPHLYRNISLEVWEEEKNVRQQQDLVVAATLQYKINDRCMVKLGPPNAPVEKNYSAIIKEDYTGLETVLVYIPELKEKKSVPIHCVKISDTQQGHNYKDLSGYYKKEEAANGPAPEDGSKDDNKNKKKRPPRGRRGPGKGGDDTGNVSEDAPRGRGRQRDRYSNRRRFPNSKDDKYVKDEEEARFMAEQLKLVELQEKDAKAFPALPVRGTAQVSPTSASAAVDVTQPPDVEIKVSQPTQQVEEKSQENDKGSASIESSPAVFWSRLKTKPANETANQSISPATSPTTRKPENHQQQTLEERTKEVISNKDENAFDKKEPQESTVTEDVEAEPVQEKEVVIEEVKPASSNVKQANALEMENKQFQPAQLKPLPIDVKHSKASGQVFEVKIPQPAKLMQQSKTSPPSKLTQQLKSPPRSSETSVTDKNIVPSLVELHDKITEPVIKNEMNEDKKEIIVPNVNENLESTPDLRHKEPPLEPLSSTVKQTSDVAVEENSVKEEEPVKDYKTKVVDAISTGATPERKTVTFAEKHKEIPAVPYGQSQKGILIVNGTNRPNQTGEQGYRSPSTEDYTAVSKDSKLPQEVIEKDIQTFQSAIANEGLQSSVSTVQQQNQAPLQYIMPYAFPPPPHGLQPSVLSVDENGNDLPEDIPTLRYFYNLGYRYHQFLINMTNQMNNQQMLYMYQGTTMQDQMMQPNPQPGVSMPQQQMYANMHHQQLAYQGIQNYQQASFQMHSTMPQTSQDSTPQHDRTSERTAHTSHTTHQQQAQQMPHQQQSGHFQQQPQQQQYFNQSWRPRPHFNNKSHASHHGNVSQAQRYTYPNAVGTARQPQYKDSNKQNRKHGMKNRNDFLGNMPHVQNQSMSHNQATPSQPTSYYIGADQNKGAGNEYYPGNLTYNYHPHMPSGMPPHSTISTRGNYN